MVIALVNAGANVTAKSIDGLTPSQYAMHRGFPEIVNLFKTYVDWYQSTVFLVAVAVSVYTTIALYMMNEMVNRNEEGEVRSLWTGI